MHVKLLGSLPHPRSPGELRRYRAILGSQLVKIQVQFISSPSSSYSSPCVVTPVQLKLEAAWAAADETDEKEKKMVSGGAGFLD